MFAVSLAPLLLRQPTSYNLNSTFLLLVYNLLRERWRSIVMSTSVCVCLSVHEDISGTACAIFTNFSVHVAYGSVLLRQGDEIRRGRGSFGIFFPIDDTLYSIAFGTRTKTAERIEMPFGTMTRVGRRYHVLDGGPDPQGEGAIWRKRSGAL